MKYMNGLINCRVSYQKNRFFRSFPDMQSVKFHNQIKVIREKYNEAKKRRNK